MICLHSDLIQLQETGHWRFGDELAAIAWKDMDRLQDIFAVLDHEAANINGLDLDDAALLDELAAFAGRVEEDKLLDYGMLDDSTDDFTLHDYLVERIWYYDSYRSQGVAKFRALMMAGKCRALYLRLIIRLAQATDLETAS